MTYTEKQQRKDRMELKRPVVAEAKNPLRLKKLRLKLFLKKKQKNKNSTEFILSLLKMEAFLLATAAKNLT